VMETEKNLSRIGVWDVDKAFDLHKRCDGISGKLRQGEM